MYHLLELRPFFGTWSRAFGLHVTHGRLQILKNHAPAAPSGITFPHAAIAEAKLQFCKYGGLFLPDKHRWPLLSAILPRVGAIVSVDYVNMISETTGIWQLK